MDPTNISKRMGRQIGGGGFLFLENYKSPSQQTGDTSGQRVDNCVDLIPGLPDDLAYQCLLRVPWLFHGKMRLVCQSWRQLLQCQYFHKNRQNAQLVQHWIFALVRCEDQLNLWRAFDPISKKWFPLPFMANNVHSKAVGLECKVVDGKLVMCGGWHGRPLKNVTILDPRTSKWMDAAPMLSPRAHFVSGVIKDCLYVGGGGDGKQPRCCSTEYYDLSANKWYALPPLDKGVSFCLGITLNDNLFVQARGGNPKETQVFCRDINMWSNCNGNMLAQPLIPHAVLDGLLYNAAISSGHYKIKTYDIETDSWTELNIHGVIYTEYGRIKCLVAFNKKLWVVKDDFEVVTVEVDRTTMSACISPFTKGTKNSFKGNIQSCHVLLA